MLIKIKQTLISFKFLPNVFATLLSYNYHVGNAQRNLYTVLDLHVQVNVKEKNALK